MAKPMKKKAPIKKTVSKPAAKVAKKPQPKAQQPAKAAKPAKKPAPVVKKKQDKLVSGKAEVKKAVVSPAKKPVPAPVVVAKKSLSKESPSKEAAKEKPKDAKSAAKDTTPSVEKEDISKHAKSADKKSASAKKAPTKKVTAKKEEEDLEDDFVGDDEIGNDEIGEYEEELKAVESLDDETEEIVEWSAEVKDKGDEEIYLTDAEGRRYCRARDCDQAAVVDIYCRYHYLLFWKKIQVRKRILIDGKLERYIEELTARYPDKFLEMIRRDLRTEKDFVSAIQELEIDESGLDNELEEDTQSYIEEVRGMGEGSSGVEDEEF